MTVFEKQKISAPAPADAPAPVDAPATGLEASAAALEAVGLRLSWVMRRRMEQELANFQLTMPQYMVLKRLERGAGPGCSMTELAESSQQVLPTMTGIVDRLEERGLVLRERDPRDRRALVVALSAEGAALLRQIAAEQRAWTMRVLEPLSPAERETAIGVLERYLSIVERDLQRPAAAAANASEKLNPNA